MSILIKGMEMPKDDTMILLVGKGMVIEVADGFASPKRPIEWAEVPTPHGRLIDADEFEKENDYFWNRDFINPKYDDTLSDLVNAAPTIIEAEE